MGDHFEIAVPSRASHLGVVRAFFRALCEECPGFRLEEREVTEIQLVLQEACINVIRHAHAERPDLPMRIRITIDRGTIVLEVHDRGRGFDPDAVPEPEAAALQEGGYGVFIMKSTMDSVEAVHTGDGFVLRMTKLRVPARREVTSG